MLLIMIQVQSFPLAFVALCVAPPGLVGFVAALLPVQRSSCSRTGTLPGGVSRQ
jgi:hypothetical protein